MYVSPLTLNISPMDQDASPEVLPVPLAKVKTYLSVDTDDFDDLIRTFIWSGAERFEEQTARTIIRRDHSWSLRSFPSAADARIKLPRGYVRAIHFIKYYTNNAPVTLTGPSSTVPGTGYQEILTTNDANVAPALGSNWPTAQIDAIRPVEISYSAGWEPSELPTTIVNAIMFWARISLDELRGQGDATRHSANLSAFEALCSPYRLARFHR